MKLYAGLNFEGASGFPLQMHNTVGCSRSVNFAGNKHGWERRGGEAARGVCCSHRGAVLIVTMEEKGKTMATGASLKWSIDPKTPLCTLPSIKWSTVSCMYNLYARAAPLSLCSATGNKYLSCIYIFPSRWGVVSRSGSMDPLMQLTYIIYNSVEIVFHLCASGNQPTFHDPTWLMQ